jgi:hypothetical protein
LRFLLWWGKRALRHFSLSVQQWMERRDASEGVVILCCGRFGLFAQTGTKLSEL